MVDNIYWRDVYNIMEKRIEALEEHWARQQEEIDYCLRKLDSGGENCVENGRVDSSNATISKSLRDTNSKPPEEKEVSEKQIDDKLNEIMTFDGDFVDASHTIKFLAKILYNLRFDLNELKLNLIKALKEDDDCELNHKEEEEDGRFYS